MTFSETKELPIHGHCDIDFVDVRLETDTTLYIDPERIALSTHPFAPTALQCINDFFSTLCHAAFAQNDLALYQLLSYGREPNETHLGLSTFASQGRGTSPEILMPIVKDMIRERLFEDQLVTQISDLSLWTPNFGYDRLSDLTTNIIRAVLYDYTLQQYEHWNIPRIDESKSLACSWNPATHEWETRQFSKLVAEGYQILLVPKVFVGRNMLSSPGQLLWKIALRYRQNEHLDKRSNLCHYKTYRDGTEVCFPPTKKEVYSSEIKGHSQKEYLLDVGHQYHTMVNELHSDHRLQNHLAPATMTDYELDNLLYNREETVG